MAELTREEFLRRKPLDQVPYLSLEMYHEDIGMLRYVANQVFPQTLRIEAGAPRDAGLDVEFEPLNFDVPEPEQGEYGASLDISLGLVGQQIKEKLNQVTDSGLVKPLEVIRRLHLSGVTEPQSVFYFEAADVQLQSRNGTITAEQVSRAGVQVALIQTAEKYPGLALSR